MALMPRSAKQSLTPLQPDGLGAAEGMPPKQAQVAHPLHLRSGLDLVKHGFDGTQLAIGVKQSITGENTCTHHACGTQVAYKLASVDSADANDVIGFQIVIEAAGGTPIAHIRAGIAHNITGNPDS